MLYRSSIISQIPPCTSPISHNAPLCYRNVHMCAHFCYKMVHCGRFVRCIVGFLGWNYRIGHMDGLAHDCGIPSALPNGDTAVLCQVIDLTPIAESTRYQWDLSHFLTVFHNIQFYMKSCIHNFTVVSEWMTQFSGKPISMFSVKMSSITETKHW